MFGHMGYYAILNPYDVSYLPLNFVPLILNHPVHTHTYCFNKRSYQVIFGFGFPTTVQVNWAFLFSQHMAFFRGVMNSGGTAAVERNECNLVNHYTYALYVKKNKI